MEWIESVATWVFVGGVVGARALHVIDRWDLYASHPLGIFAIWNGGLAIMGAVLGGTVAGVFVALRRGLPVRAIADAAAPAAILGQAIGRFACLFTGDAVGRPTSGFGVTYLNPGAMVPQLGVAYEPVFLYEMGWDLALFGALLALRGRLRRGGLFALYLGSYAVGKFAITSLRTERLWVGDLQQAQLLAVAALLVALGWAAWPTLERAKRGTLAGARQ
jgi:phosphatidylglycerol:prolipoprotein diacylglycerol transferase